MSYPSNTSSLRHAVRFVLGAVGAAALLAVTPVRAQEPVQPIAPAKVTSPGKVELGKKLWFDPRLSRSGFISCNSCHNLSMGGSDNLKTSLGPNGDSNANCSRNPTARLVVPPSLQ